MSAGALPGSAVEARRPLPGVPAPEPGPVPDARAAPSAARPGRRRATGPTRLALRRTPASTGARGERAGRIRTSKPATRASRAPSRRTRPSIARSPAQPLVGHPAGRPGAPPVPLVVRPAGPAASTCPCSLDPPFPHVPRCLAGARAGARASSLTPRFPRSLNRRGRAPDSAIAAPCALARKWWPGHEAGAGWAGSRRGLDHP